MSSITRRAPWVVAVTLVAAGAAGCSGDTGPDLRTKGDPDGAKDTAPVQTVITLQHLSNGMSDQKRTALKADVAAAVDPWLDDAWLGDFPRTDYASAFAGFTRGAAADAEGRDVALMTNQALSDQIDAATATRRRVKLDVFATKGRARGATAHVTLDFTTTGKVAESRRVTGDLYLAKDKGAWKVFGYDVDEAVTR